LEGIPTPGATVNIVDAATGKAVATVTSDADNSALIELHPRAAQVFYAESTAPGQRYRSRPFQAAPDRGVQIPVMVMPRMLATFDLRAQAEGEFLAFRVHYSLSNNSWFPYSAGPSGLVLPLPSGAQGAVVADVDADHVTVTPTGFRLARPLEPGATTFVAGYSLLAAKGKVRLAQDLPLGAYTSRLAIVKEPGMAVELLPKLVATVTTTGKLTYFVVEDIMLPPNRALDLTITMPVYPRAEMLVRSACRAMALDRTHALIGKPLADFTAPQLDGTRLTLSSLRGKPMLVNFTATFDNLAHTERPTLAKLAATLPELAIVLVASDADPKKVRDAVGPKPPYRVVLDVPTAANLGPITTAWGVSLIPESFLIDRKGIVRAYVVNSRDWGTPDSLGCVQALLR
nr:TlpA family protein disulfide reductase [Deltaproteobacteria bacterium]